MNVYTEDFFLHFQIIFGIENTHKGFFKRNYSPFEYTVLCLAHIGTNAKFL